MSKLSGARARAAAVTERGQGWVESRDPASKQGVAVAWWKAFRDVEGPRQSILLTTYVFLAVFPALLVLAEYMENNPAALANHLVARYGLSHETTVLLRGVLVDTETHKLGTALLAMASALFFGLGFGYVLQRVHMRAWRIDLRIRTSDQARYAAVLLVLFGMILVLLVQATELVDAPGWDEDVLAIGWFLVLVAYFVWAPYLLMHGRLPARAFVGAAVLTSVCIVGLVLVSSFLLATWVDFYAKDYGGFGVVMALFFWIGVASTIIVVAASLSPALGARRDLLRERAQPPD